LRLLGPRALLQTAFANSQRGAANDLLIKEFLPRNE
jgi:hypothetical protein